MKLVRLSKTDGTWENLENLWKEECENYEEDYDSYAQASLGTLRYECENGEGYNATGVYTLTDDTGKLHAACFLNSTLLKGYTGKVLRVRHFILSPYYDFEDLELDDYANILASFFVSLVEISDGELKSPHIKIHYRSPYDRTFFAAFGLTMRSTGRFRTVETKGMWLHLTK